ncbi:sigma 54-interacting transcriptional regulator [Desulfosporosinus metallidurans]|uniref:Response regulator of zinc sigma-54-dependent two-component system n=1 Tax=Desulfosporosinus metallidurans TaxID=1888891 RepID=A0A1Q8QS75_9FIRM|nr:sigma 54-interacting transcriptional regulator [Desulfosporosinus metallidurans]OLN30201.1 Response regulator of zinc sigma-54-dependent two-component system [Desulfosporosinus metallidurans]
MKVEEIMIAPICIQPEQAVVDVLTKLSDLNAEGLLVKSQEKVLGVIERRQLTNPQIIYNPVKTAVDIMQAVFPIVNLGDNVQKVWELEVEVLPVFDQELLVGMVTRVDVGMAIFREKELGVKTFDAVANSVTSGIVAIDEFGKITAFNKAAEKFTWRKQHEALGGYLGDMIIPTGLLDVIKTGLPQFDFRIEAFDRAYISNRTPIIEDGEVVGAVGVFQDISEIESALHELKVLNELNAELNTVINSSFDGILVTNELGRVLRTNAAACMLCRLEEQDILQQFVDDVLQLQRPSLWKSILRGRKAVTKEVSARHLLITGNPVFKGDGSLRRVIFNLRDLSLLHELRDELKTTKELSHKYRQELDSLRKGGDIIAHSPKMLSVLDLAKRVASVDSSVFIKGESGVGKEVIAKFIHENSKRSSGPFIQVNCAAIPENLLESELFGYEGGAFTGSRKEGKSGLFELANQGTLLLDEIGDLPLILQSKLLRVIQEREFVRVGGTKVRKIDIRLISATHRDISEMVKEGLFREDLFFRLHVVPLSIPSLRERPEDILPLVHSFRDKVCYKYGLDKDFAPEVLQWFLSGKWPGNVRQIQNTVEQLIVTCPESVVTINQLVQEQLDDTSVIQVNSILPLKEAGCEVERQIFYMALKHTRNTYELGKLLGVNQSTVVRKLQRLGIAVLE